MKEAVHQAQAMAKGSEGGSVKDHTHGPSNGGEGQRHWMRS